MIRLLLQKVAKLLAFHEKITDLNLKITIEKNINILIYNLSDIQIVFPLLFHLSFKDYMQIIEMIMQNSKVFKENSVLKSSLICFSKIIKTYSYYSDSDTICLAFKSQQKQNYMNWQNICFQNFHIYFTEEKLQQIFNFFILEIMPNDMKEHTEDENQIENGY